jgi:MoaA/NifB/PqqE/SkfB family radical SAM enzyme
MMLNNVRRRREWFLENARPRQLGNFLLAATEFALKREVMRAWPVLVKIDISPLCNLRCTYCVHARPSGDTQELLEQQSFNRRQKMAVDHVERIVQEIGGKSMAVSLYYLGDPLLHPELAEICGLARAARLNSHVSTHFSFKLSDEALRKLVFSGLTHLTVCVDALHQETYERTRVGGRLDLVLDNLDRALAMRREAGRKYPRIEVQFIKFQHNLADLPDLRRWCHDRGVDQFTDYWGNLHNYADVAPGNYRVFGPRRDRSIPQCTWPHFSMQIKYDGDVIPCCYYRHTDQYRESGDSRTVGNVLRTSVWDVWNSVEYRALRRLVANPTRASSDPSASATFCHGCPTIFETDVEARVLTADKHAWEDLYTKNGRQVVRLPLVATGNRDRTSASPGGRQAAARP